MKRIISLLLVVVLACAFVGCSNRNKYSEEAISAAEATIMYSEQYFDGIISLEETGENIDVVVKDLLVYLELDETKEKPTYQNDNALYTKISDVLALYIQEYFYDGGQIANIKESVDNLKEEIGYE